MEVWDPFNNLIFFHISDVGVWEFIDDCFLFSLIILQKLSRFYLNLVKFTLVECFFAVLNA